MLDKKITYISFLQVIGPIFVILGHSLNGLDTAGWWYVFSKEWIYLFHMPLFFLISGYLLSFKGFLHGRSYRGFMLGKTKRLLAPYLFWNLLFCVPKIMAQPYLSDSAPSNLWNMLKAFIFPRQNVWGHTWFLLGLFVIYALAPLFEKIFNFPNKQLHIGLVVFCIILYILPIQTEFLAFSDLHKDLLFFVLGCLLGKIPQEKFLQKMWQQRFLWMLCAVIASVAALIWYAPTKPFHFVPCAFILLSLLAMGCCIQNLPGFFQKLAESSFGIYILHWPVMLAVRIVLHQILGIGPALTAFAMIVLGWAVPLAVLAFLRRLPGGKIKKPLKYLLGV